MSINKNPSVAKANQLIHVCSDPSMPPSLKRVEKITGITYEEASTKSEFHKPKDMEIEKMSGHTKAAYVAFIWANWEIKKAESEDDEVKIGLLNSLRTSLAGLFEYQLQLEKHFEKEEVQRAAAMA
jgi:hypothetical protein